MLHRFEPCQVILKVLGASKVVNPGVCVSKFISAILAQREDPGSVVFGASVFKSPAVMTTAEHVL